MHKIEGLKFLQTFFWDVCVDCVFINPAEPFEEHLGASWLGRIFRVRSGRRSGVELNCPQKTCHLIEDVRKFVDKMLEIDKSLQFVVHRVDESYFKPDFVGTIALFEKSYPQMIIEFQAVSKELVEKIDTGLRPRDWKVVATFVYPFLSASPKLCVSDHVFDPTALKSEIYHLWCIGRRIDFLKQSSGEICETVTRFNVYPSGSVLLDDHRNVSSFSGRV